MLKAASKGSFSSMYNLGQMYWKGDGIKKDEKYAAKIFSWLARRNDIEATLNLGYMYNYGEGVPRNEQRAKQLYSKCARAGSSKAMYNLGLMALEKEDPDVKDAMSWLTKASRKGHPKAAKKLKAIKSSAKRRGKL